MKGEQKYDEMVQVLDHLHDYVPTVSSTERVPAPRRRTGYIDVVNDTIHQVLLGKLRDTTKCMLMAKGLCTNVFLIKLQCITFHFMFLIFIGDLETSI